MALGVQSASGYLQVDSECGHASVKVDLAKIQSQWGAGDIHPNALVLALGRQSQLQIASLPPQEILD